MCGGACGSVRVKSNVMLEVVNFLADVYSSGRLHPGDTLLCSAQLVSANP